MGVTLDDHFRDWFLGNENEVQFCRDLYDAAQEWDDLEDEGHCRHNDLMSWLAFGKEWNPFFMAHASILRPAMLGMFLQWTAANVLDREPEQIHKAYMLRAGIYGVFHMVAWIIGGNAHATIVGPKIYRMYSETLADLRKELTCPDLL